MDGLRFDGKGETSGDCKEAKARRVRRVVVLLCCQPLVRPVWRD
jgi:hypothetical protein